MRINVGQIHAQLQVTPPAAPSGAKRGCTVSRDSVTRVMRNEASADGTAERHFIKYARSWLKEYDDEAGPRRSRRDRTRGVKLFAEDEEGRHRMVCSFLCPLRAPAHGRASLETPFHAARFVSLLPLEREDERGLGLGAERIERWPTLHTVLAKRAGSSASHAVLLCSLLLGFGLDAWVCVGTVANKAEGAAPVERRHYWVMTRDSSRRQIVFWESLTGSRTEHSRDGAIVDSGQQVGDAALNYIRLVCVFNHRFFLANVQRTDEVLHCGFDLSLRKHWKPVDQKLIASLAPVNTAPPPLCPPELDAHAIAMQLEHDLRRQITRFRHESLNEPVTKWNDHMSYMLGPALVSYETEKVAGAPLGSVERLWRDSIRRSVPSGCTFAAYPAMCNHTNSSKMMQLLLADAAARDIVNTHDADAVQFSLRVKVFLYPEDLVSVWLTLAVVFLPFDS